MQRQSFIQYDSNRGSAAAANREDTRPWRVVVNPQIERERRRNQVTRRARRLSRALCAVACGILATGLVGQITMSVALNAQSKRQSELYGQIFPKWAGSSRKRKSWAWYIRRTTNCARCSSSFQAKPRSLPTRSHKGLRGRATCADSREGGLAG